MMCIIDEYQFLGVEGRELSVVFVKHNLVDSTASSIKAHLYYLLVLFHLLCFCRFMIDYPVNVNVMDLKRMSEN